MLTKEQDEAELNRASAWYDEQRDLEQEAAIERRERRQEKRLQELKASLEARGYNLDELDADNPYNGGLNVEA